MKILAVKWRRLGDTVLWSSALEALREWAPYAQIDLAMPAPYVSLYRSDPRFTPKYALEESFSWDLISKIRREKYDLALLFHASPRALRLTLLAGAKEKLVHHHSRKGRNYFSDRPIPGLGKPMAANERDLNLVRALGWTGLTPPTQLFVAPGEIAKGKLTLSEAGWKEDRPLVLLSMGASRPSKLWPLERYLSVIETFRSQAQVGIVFDDVSAFRGQPEFSERATKAGALLLPTPTLSDLVGYLSHAKVFLGSDSGVKHLACALGVSTVTLFGPESLGEWHFYDEKKHRALQRPVGCRDHDPVPPEFAWCGAEICPYGSHACLTQIQMDDVAKEVSSLLKVSDSTLPD